MYVVPDAAATYVLDQLIDALTLWLHLYITDTALSQATQAGDLVEATFDGYLPVQLRSWSPSITTSGRAESTSDPVVWTAGNGLVPQSVYGYWISQGQSGQLLVAESNDGGPIVITTPGQQILVAPRLTFRADPTPAS